MSESKDIQRMLTAASEGATDTVRRFLELGLAVDAQDRHGNRAINHAAKAGHAEVVRLLLDYSANVNEPDGIGRTPLIACAEGDHTQIVELLLDAGADINGVGDGGRTALMECANSSSKNVAIRLLELGANVNMQRDDGSTALHEAVYFMFWDRQFRLVGLTSKTAESSQFTGTRKGTSPPKQSYARRAGDRPFLTWWLHSRVPGDGRLSSINSAPRFAMNACLTQRR